MRLIKLQPKYYIGNVYVRKVVFNYLQSPWVLYMNYGAIFKLKFGYINGVSNIIEQTTKYFICG